MNLLLSSLNDILARMPVPKMAKNGQNSVFVFESRITPTRKTWKPGKIKTALKAQKRIKTIFGQFRNTHARYVL
jgi:hypothetical protein